MSDSKLPCLLPVWKSILFLSGMAFIVMITPDKSWNLGIYVFGSIATFLGAFFSYKLRKNRWLVPVPPIVANTIIVPFVLYYAYGINLPIPLMMVSVGIGEVISCAVLGMILLTALSRYGNRIFGNPSVVR